MTTRVWKNSRNIRTGLLLSILVPRLEDILFMSIFFAVLGLGPRLLNMDGDLGRHITIGDYILDNQIIPTKDLFSHSMQGLDLTPHEWMAQILFALSHRLAEMDGVVMLSALIIATTFTLVFRQCFERSNMLLVSLGICLIAAATASIHWLARPHLFTMLFTVLWIGELEKFRRDRRLRWWVLIIIMLVWVNFHGAFIAGFVIWGIYFLDSLFPLKSAITISRKSEWNLKIGELVSIPAMKLFLLGVIAFCLTFLNPVGWRIWETTLGFLRSRYLVSHTVEYLPPNFHQISAWPFLFMIGGSILLLSLTIRKRPIASALLLSVWTVMGLISARNISLYAVITAPILAVMASNFVREKRKLTNIVDFDLRLRMVNYRLVGHIWPLALIIVLGIVLIGGINLDFRGESNRFSPQVFPVEAVDWVSQQGEFGPVFNYFPWGGYLLYRMWPQEQVFIDGQTDFYGESLTRKYEQVITINNDWLDILDQYKITWVIMPPQSELIKNLRKEIGWEELYLDDTAAILFREP